MKPFACVLALVLSPFCFGQTITVRVLNGNNGHPLAKQTVSVQFLYKDSSGTTDLVKFETDSDGKVQFEIPAPEPEHVVFRLPLSGHWHCRCWVMMDTQKLILTGSVESAEKVRINPPVSKPGEIVFIARPYTFFERILYQLQKD